MQEALDNSSVLDQLCADLSKALPSDIDKDALSLATNASANDDALAGVRLRIAKDGKTKDVIEQSDGLRALYALALYDLVSVGSNMVAIDEPEIHLHPTSQRSLALQTGHNQKVLATHSPDIISAFPADCIVSVRVASGKKRAVLARHVRNHRLYAAIDQWAFSALNASPGARAFYDLHRAAGDLHHQKRYASSATASSASCTAA